MKKFNIGDRVRFDHGKLKGTGTVAGIATDLPDVATFYIVTLDEPLTLEGYEGWTACTVHHAYMERIDNA